MSGFRLLQILEVMGSHFSILWRREFVCSFGVDSILSIRLQFTFLLSVHTFILFIARKGVLLYSLYLKLVSGLAVIIPLVWHACQRSMDVLLSALRLIFEEFRRVKDLVKDPVNRSHSLEVLIVHVGVLPREDSYIVSFSLKFFEGFKDDFLVFEDARVFHSLIESLEVLILLCHLLYELSD